VILALLDAAGAFDEPLLYWPAEARPVVLEWNGAPEGWSDAEALVELEAAAALWNEQACFDELLVLQPGAVASRDASDQIQSVTFGDPLDEIDPERSGTVYPLGTGEEVVIGGLELPIPYDVDTVFNDIAFASEAEIDGGSCQGRRGLRAAAARLFGHVLGIGTSCDPRYDPCTEAESAGIMDYTADTCEPAPESLATDDILALHWLYGTPFDFACVAVADDPHGVACHVGGPALSGITWNLGDGTTSEGESVSHSYDAAGEYLVTSCFTMDDCGASLCLDHVVYAVDAGEVNDLATVGDEACGCDSPGAGVALPLLWFGRRRRG